MIHYHGGPITPETAARKAWAGRHAFISWARPDQIRLAAGICQSFALDNGAFTFWKQGGVPGWDGYYGWCEQWLAHPGCDWAVIPDVIGGGEDDNDALAAKWPFGRHCGVPVWHLNESPERLARLAGEWPRVALGSADEWDVSVPSRCLERLHDVLPVICRDGQPAVKLHGLRMLNPAITAVVPLASADSTNIARNIGIDGRWGVYGPATKDTRAVVLAERIEAVQTPARLDGPLLRQAAARRGQGMLWDDEPG